MRKYTNEDVQAFLGKDYRIGEATIIRDFGNGFDLEIDNIWPPYPCKYGNIYLWFERRRIVRMISGVPKKFIKDVADDLFEYSEWLCRCGLNTDAGMSAYSAALQVSKLTHSTLFQLDFTLAKRAFLWYTALYAGIMVSKDGAKLRVLGFDGDTK